MDIKKYLKTMPVLAALLLTASCSSDDNELVETPQPAPQVRIIHYEATVGSGSQTRATLDGSDNYVFETGDKLYVWGDKISGELTLTSGASSSSATFSGDLTYTPNSGDPDTPADDLSLSAVIVSPTDKIFGTLAEFAARNYEPSYTLSASTPYASNSAEAVQRFSYFKAYSQYQEKSFDFYNNQNSIFLSFDITLEDGTAAGTTIPVIISNGGSEISKGSVTTVKEGESIKAKFVAGIKGYITANNATVTLDNRDAISFGNTSNLWPNNVYNVKRTYTRYKIVATGSIYSVPFTIPKENIKNETTLGEILGDKFKTITSFSSSGSSITFGTLNETDWGQTTVTVNSTGVTTITISGEASYSGFDIPLTDQVVTLTVSKMTPPAE